MDILLLIKDLLINKELIGMFIFSFVALYLLFRDAKSIIKILRIILVGYIVSIMLIKLVIINI